MDSKELIQDAEKRAEQIAQKVSTSQIRNIFGRIKNIQLKWEKGKNDEKIYNQIILIKPKLVYIDKKNSHKNNTLEKNISPLIDEIDQKNLTKSLEIFFDKMEAIVCYHKKYSRN